MKTKTDKNKNKEKKILFDHSINFPKIHYIKKSIYIYIYIYRERERDRQTDRE